MKTIILNIIKPCNRAVFAAAILLSLVTAFNIQAQFNYTALTVPRAENTFANGISGANIVGYYTTNGYANGFLYNGNGYTTLSVQEAKDTYAEGISGTNIVGYYYGGDYGLFYYGFLYNGSAYATLNVPGAEDTYAYGISGTNIVGYYYNGSSDQGFLYNGSAYTTLSVPGAQDTYAEGISGTNIVGYYNNGSGEQGFLYNGGAYTTFSAPGAEDTYPSGISGTNIVGYYYNGTSNQGFLYNGSAYTTLNVPGAENTGASGIDSLNIVGSYFNGNDYESFLATPILVITNQPENQIAVLSSNVAFSVSAGGVPPLNYQWYFSNTNLQTAAGAYAQMLHGFVYGVVVTNGGSGYTTVPNVQFIGGGDSGAGGTAVLSNGMVTAINITNAGSGYATAPAVQIDPPNGLLIGQTNSILTLNDVTTNDVGNYFVVVSDTFGNSVTSLTTGVHVPGIMQQPQSVNVAQGNNAVFNVAACGTPPFSYQWWMVSEAESNATAVPFVTNGFVLAASITSGGAGYLSVPPVQIVGGSGSGAAGYAVVSNCMVTAIIITNAGICYSNPPEIQIAAPCAISLSGQTCTNLILPAVNAANDGDYFVVVTNDYGSVTSAVAALTVFLPPQGLNVSAANGSQLTLQFTGTVGYPYILQTATNLTPPINWQAIITNLADADGNWSFTITNSPNIPCRFYRAAAQ